MNEEKSSSEKKQSVQIQAPVLLKQSPTEKNPESNEKHYYGSYKNEDEMFIAAEEKQPLQPAGNVIPRKSSALPDTMPFDKETDR